MSSGLELFFDTSLYTLMETQGMNSPKTYICYANAKKYLNP